MLKLVLKLDFFVGSFVGVFVAVEAGFLLVFLLMLKLMLLLLLLLLLLLMLLLMLVLVLPLAVAVSASELLAPVSRGPFPTASLVFSHRSRPCGSLPNGLQCHPRSRRRRRSPSLEPVGRGQPALVWQCHDFPYNSGGIMLWRKDC